MLSCHSGGRWSLPSPVEDGTIWNARLGVRKKEAEQVESDPGAGFRGRRLIKEPPRAYRIPGVIK